MWERGLQLFYQIMTGILANNLVSGIVICVAGKGCWRKRQQEPALKTYLVAKERLQVFILSLLI